MDHQPCARDGASTPIPVAERISARAVATITGLSRKRIAEAALLGHLTVWRPPAGVGGLVRYSKASAEALARSLVTPASSPPVPSKEPATDDA